MLQTEAAEVSQVFKGLLLCRVKAVDKIHSSIFILNHNVAPFSTNNERNYLYIQKFLYRIELK